MWYHIITISMNRTCSKAYWVTKISHTDVDDVIMTLFILRNIKFWSCDRLKRGLNQIELETFWILQSILTQRSINTISWLKSCWLGFNQKLSFLTNQTLRIILMVSSGSSLSLTHIGKALICHLTDLYITIWSLVTWIKKMWHVTQDVTADHLGVERSNAYRFCTDTRWL